MNKKEFFSKVKFDNQGLIPVIAQDYHSKKVRMMAYMNEEALSKTIDTGQVYYYSRSRNQLWLKGDTSGYFQYLKGLSIDCDGDTLLIQIEQVGGISCHTGNSSCFFTMLDDFTKTKIKEEVLKETSFLSKLTEIILERKNNPIEGSYTNYLFNEGLNKILKKVGEEATETIIAAKDNKDDVIFEVADLMYHLSVMLIELGLNWNDVLLELEKRG